ncbi:MAG: ABC transporter ATP-binding protein [Nitrospinae bacterium]|nr:ABC transporter ATP-binding protein [Nitrospinota bacterium]
MTNEFNYAVTAEELAQDYGGTRNVEGVSFNVARGEMFGLVGPNGGGKSTLIRLLCGLMAPTAGRALLFGKNPRENREIIKNDVGYFSQRFSLYGDLTVEENIAFFAEIHGVFDRRGREAELLEFTRLAPFKKRLADQLSGGMKQKLALVCAIIHKPKIIFLDEPTTGVDPVSRMDFWRILSSLLSTGITIIMSTPYMDEAERCGRIALISHDGSLLAVDTPHNVKKMMKGEILEIVCERPREAKKILEALPGMLDVQSFGDRLNVSVGDGASAMPAAELAMKNAGVEPGGMRIIPPSLENVFISLLTR